MEYFKIASSLLLVASLTGSCVGQIHFSPDWGSGKRSVHSTSLTQTARLSPLPASPINPTGALLSLVRKYVTHKTGLISKPGDNEKEEKLKSLQEKLEQFFDLDHTKNVHSLGNPQSRLFKSIKIGNPTPSRHFVLGADVSRLLNARRVAQRLPPTNTVMADVPSFMNGQPRQPRWGMSQARVLKDLARILMREAKNLAECPGCSTYQQQL